MIIDELDISAEYKLSRILRLLENLYGMTIDFANAKSRAELVSLYETYRIAKQAIIREADHNSYNNDREYAKACLIQEAVTIFLGEIAPLRKGAARNTQRKPNMRQQAGADSRVREQA
jgi:hypothetical protein